MQLLVKQTDIEEFEALWKIYVHYFGEEGMGWRENCLRFLQCAYCNWTLKDGDQVVGGFALHHLVPSFLDDILSGRRADNEVALHHMVPVEPGKPIRLYVAVMAIDATLPLHLKRLYAGCLTASFARIMLALRAMDIRLETIYGVAVTAEGNHILRRFGFVPLEGGIHQGLIRAYHFPVDARGVQRLEQISKLAPGVEVQMPVVEVAL
ncbi:hypothetical protein EI42_02664 [Thermosporothrix hazakensis]|jgi:hypothetical protein|uniref:N-acetyltransferase domain-containing protein n=2 Tax=Thermosporothrix TaxID=768650 RepID=A0A326U5Z1_THEHA|nr:hypothetical protein [Thermosporothrix hazakensis]PZW29370.1 hypothetical protein EI42_02664 [Thermosporothrix hazakensis]BBH85655.1 hypothetical protein KTC_04060 [Thermosporothrix sp. COM3]GCE45916.1 hypothetical protein KTH_07850 [Thermosporothrix hazakensis]